MQVNSLKHLLFLSRLNGLGAVRVKRLIEKFGSAESVFAQHENEIAEIDNFSIKIAKQIINSYNSGFNAFDDDFNKYLDKAKKLDVKIITLDSDEYPDLLKKIYDPPVILYTRGNYDKKLLENSIGIVGTRKPTDYGKKIAEKFANELSSVGISVISGFARGVDTAAHKAVLNNINSSAVTAAVFECGVDIIYPPENKILYEDMLLKGLLLSEFELSAFPDAANFPKRNRIISGISLGTVVIESDSEGGALITARTALDQGREVFAVPGYITSRLSNGTNALIKNGHAKLVENLDDILMEIHNNLIGISLNLNNSLKPVNTVVPDLNSGEKLVYDTFLMTIEPIHIDVISEKSGLNISDCLVTLLNLEFKGIVEQLPGKRFKLS
ncbi:MAG: DNA-protecting protein DprA [Ignavibacteria bacterium]|nr:DNA-protecting protein DprA [Ignavibacteria bacterium]